MFNDNEPEGPEYIFGDLNVIVEPLVMKSVRVTSFKKKTFLKRKDEIFPIGKPIFNYTETIIPEERPEYSPKNENIVYKNDLPKNAEDLEIKNLVDIDEDDLDLICERSEELSKYCSDILLKESAALLMSYDKSSSYVEAVLRDGLGINIEIDNNICVAIGHLVKINVLNFYANQMTSIPEELRARFLKQVTYHIAQDAISEMKKENVGEKYTSFLKNLVARVKKSDKPIGTVRSHYQEKPEKDRSTEEQHKYNDRQAAGVKVSRR